MLQKFAEFIREREFLHNVSPATVAWHTHNLKWMPNENPSESELKEMVIRMRQKGLKPTGCNSVIRSVNAYLHWLTDRNNPCSPACRHFRLSALREERRELPTFSGDQIQLLLRWKPQTTTQYRLSTLVAMLLDIGCRIEEALSLRWEDIDHDNFFLQLTGKGRKQRTVPFSLELRRRLFLLQRRTSDKGLVFGTRDGNKQGRRNVLRDVKALCRTLGFEPPERTLHAMRHTMATFYIRRGGESLKLQRVLGHSTLAMTSRYVHMVADDLRSCHEQLSPLGRA